MKLITFNHFASLGRKERLSFSKTIGSTLPGSWHFAGLGIDDDQLPTYLDYRSGIPFKLILGGTFQMGCGHSEEVAARAIDEQLRIDFDSLRPVHNEDVEPFLMSITPVLIGEYLWMGGNELGDWRGWPGHPVAVTREEAVALAEKFGCRLPREAEWEYACRGGNQTLFPWGDTLLAEDELERWLDNNFAGNSQRACNRFGLKGLFTGEWCIDEYRENYLPSSKRRAGQYVVRAGGSRFWPWENAGEWTWCMPAMRMPSADLPPERTCGFRLVREL